MQTAAQQHQQAAQRGKFKTTGNVAVGERVQIGIGSCVIQGLSIGAGSIVGAGSVVVKNTAANVVTFGSPAQVYRKLA